MSSSRASALRARRHGTNRTRDCAVVGYAQNDHAGAPAATTAARSRAVGRDRGRPGCRAAAVATSTCAGGSATRATETCVVAVAAGGRAVVAVGAAAAAAAADREHSTRDLYLACFEKEHAGGAAAAATGALRATSAAAAAGADEPRRAHDELTGNRELHRATPAASAAAVL